jgi:outer membrane protein OmpA-like peptidoglycan-associated protein
MPEQKVASQKKQEKTNQSQRDNSQYHQASSQNLFTGDISSYEIGDMPYNPDIQRHIALLSSTTSSQFPFIMRQLQQAYGNRYVQRLVESVQMKPDTPTSKPVEDKPAGDLSNWSKTLDKFEHNSSELTTDHYKAIDTLSTEIADRISLDAGAKATITIIGHTDTSGDEKYNEGLGLKRANSAKSALQAAFSKKKIGEDRIAGIDVESAGEKDLAKRTADNVREPLNRRVEITVKIEGLPPAVSEESTKPPLEAGTPRRKKPIDLNLPPNYKLPEEDWWKRTERELSKIKEYERTHPTNSKDINEVLADGVIRVLDPIIKKLPDSLREKAREGIRKAVEAGTEKSCEAMIDATGVTGEKADAMKAACKAALNTKFNMKK